MLSISLQTSLERIANDLYDASQSEAFFHDGDCPQLRSAVRLAGDLLAASEAAVPLWVKLALEAPGDHSLDANRLMAWSKLVQAVHAFAQEG